MPVVIEVDSSTAGTSGASQPEASHHGVHDAPVESSHQGVTSQGRETGTDGDWFETETGGKLFIFDVLLCMDFFSHPFVYFAVGNVSERRRERRRWIRGTRRLLILMVDLALELVIVLGLARALR